MKDKQILRQAITDFFNHPNTKLDNDGWTNLADLGGYLSKLETLGKSYISDFGYVKLKDIAEDKAFQSLLVHRIDTSKKVPVSFIKLKLDITSANSSSKKNQSIKMASRIHNGIEIKSARTDNEYIEAAERHLKTCKKILSEDNLLMNVFYLSGYVIECIASFAVFNSNINLKKTTALRHDMSLKHEPAGLLDALDRENILKVPTKPELYKKWTPELRYEKSGNFNRQQIEEFLVFSEKVHSEISYKFRPVKHG